MPYQITREDAERDAAAIRTACLKWAYLSNGAEFIDTLRELADSIEEQVKPVVQATTPTVGQTVHYVDHINHGGGYARCFDAVVDVVNADGTIDVTELLPGTPAYSLVESGKPGDLYTWHLPCGGVL